MHKRDYFINALKAESYRWKKWVIGCFSIVLQPEATEDAPDSYPYQLYRNANGYYFRDPQNNHEITWLEGADPKFPAFDAIEELVLGVGDLPNVKQNVTTTYGVALFNQIGLCYAFGDKIEFLNDRPIEIGKVEGIIQERLRDDPPEGAERDPKFLYVSEYKKFNEAVFSLAGYAQLWVPSATPRTMTTDPRIPARRKELLEQYKDRLHDPVVQATIDAELIKMDKEWIKGDPDAGFYYRAKSFNVVRKKVFLLQGAEQGFGVQGGMIPNSLEDGWDIKYMPAMSNSLREGSYARGSETQLGGEATKFNYRIFQNTMVSEDDCGTTFGLMVLLTKDNVEHYITNFALTKTGTVEITKENAESFIGKTVRVRSPIYCKTSGANFCAKCMGGKIAATPHAVATYAADIGSLFMNVFMKKMHGKALLTADWDFNSSIR